MCIRDRDYTDPNLYILPAFGVNSARIYVDNGVVKYGALEENFKEYLKYMNRLFTEGLIDQEWATQDDSTRIGKAKGNTVGIAAQAIPDVYKRQALADKPVKIGSTGAAVTENTEVAIPHIIRQNIDYVGMLILFHH